MNRPRANRKAPDVIFTQTFLNPPGGKQELREIMLWWEMALVRSAQEKIKQEIKT